MTTLKGSFDPQRDHHRQVGDHCSSPDWRDWRPGEGGGRVVRSWTQRHVGLGKNKQVGASGSFSSARSAVGTGGRRGMWVNRKPQKAVFVSPFGFQSSDLIFFSPHQYIFLGGGGTKPVIILIHMRI